jgi:hypothetical protein
MSMAPEAYRAWLRRDGPRCVLLEVKVYHDGGEITRYLSDVGYVTGPAEIPPDQYYADLLLDIPPYSVNLSGLMGQGEIVLSNHDGSLDAWLEDAWDGRDFTLLLGAPEWPRDDFTPILTGIVDHLVAHGEATLGLVIRDRSEALNGPIPQEVYPSGVSHPSEGLHIPYALGYPLLVSPRLTNTATHEYQIHNGEMVDIYEVYDRGYAVTFLADTANGKCTLSTFAQGTLTAQVTGAKRDADSLYGASSFAIQTPADCLFWILRKMGLTLADIDQQSFLDLDIADPGPLGIYLSDRTNALQLIDEILTTCAASRIWTRSGKLRLWRLEEPIGVPDHVFGPDDVVEGGMDIVERWAPWARQAWAIDKNWTPQDASALADGVPEFHRRIFPREYLVIKTQQNPGILTTYKGALSPEQIPTLYSGANTANINAELTRRMGLRDTWRTVYAVDFFACAFGCELGQIVNLEYPRYGWAGGVNAVIVGIEEMALQGRVKLLLWR